jgi:transposase InsO family protein
MAQLLHGSATTTARTRAEFQNSREPVAALARCHGVNPKTVAKWRGRDSVEDLPMGPRERKSTTLTPLEEAAIVAFRVQTHLPLDDVFCALKPSIPALTRSTLHRCLQRHGVSRLPRPARERRGRFRSYEIGYFHIDVCEVRIEQGKAHLFVAVDRTSKFAFARLYRRATTLTSVAFLKALVKAVPYRIHTILTDNGIQFADAGKPRRYGFPHPFGRLCRAYGIEHRLTRPYHPWTNGQVERMVRTLKEASVRTYHYETFSQLRRHISKYLVAYNFAKHLKTLRWKTPYETIQALWDSKPELFRDSPDHLTPGPNT